MMPKLPEPDVNFYNPFTEKRVVAYEKKSVRAIQEEAYKAGWSAAVPDGWKVVPVVPTKEMVDAWISTYEGYIQDVWKAMLSASPEVK
jgi:hypothetical protein